MTKHLRFGRLLSLLAIMLTLSFAWAQGQNLSQEKVLKTFEFTTAANPTALLGSNCVGTVVTNETTHTVDITVPYVAHIDALVADFTSSWFSKLYVGQNPATGILAVSGVSPAVDYTNPVVWTVEAENWSFENYVVTVTRTEPVTAAVTVFSANYRKVVTCPDANVILPGRDVAFDGMDITFNVNFGAVLDDITVYFSVSPGATAVPAVSAAGTVLDFDADNDGEPEALPIVVTSVDGIETTYMVTPVFDQPASSEKNLIATGAMTVPSMDIAGASSVVSDPATKTITVVVPNSTTEIAPTWKISDFAKMYATDPTGGEAEEICSGGSFALTTSPQTLDFYIKAEDNSVNHWQVVVSKTPLSPENYLLAIKGEWHKTNDCGVASTGEVDGTSITNDTDSTGTVTFAVPYQTTEVLVLSPFMASTASVANQFSYMATSDVVGGTTVLQEGGTFTITAENGSVRTYTVVFTAGAMSREKELLTFGFKQEFNDNFSFTWEDGAYYTTDGPINQTTKLVTVRVPFITNLHTMVASFTSSPGSCVYIAESNGEYTLQTSEQIQNDHSNSLTYVVRAEDGTEERYDVEVLKEEAGDNELMGFESYNEYCFETTNIYAVEGVYTETSETVTDIALSVRYGTDPATLPYMFTISPWATVKMGDTPLTPDEDGVYSGLLGGSPVSFFVTSDAGVTMEYVVTVEPREENSDAAILSYAFTGANNGSALGAKDFVGVVDDVAKTVYVLLPWTAKDFMTSLVPSFTLNPFSVMTQSGEGEVIQVSGVTAHDFTTPQTFTVWAEDCTPVEYTVTVEAEPNTSAGISAFEFDVEGCGCNLTDFSSTSYIDTYARRINITLPYTVDLTALAPSVIGVAKGATTSPAVTDAQDWTAGAITYTVTAPDGVTTLDWTVMVTNPPCTETEILAFSLPGIQVDPADLVAGHGEPVVIHADTHTIDVIIKMGSNLTQVPYEVTLPCGATISGDNFMDFTERCHTVVVTSQDETVFQDWTICVHDIDGAVPNVETWNVMAYNCSGAEMLDSVAVQTDYVGPDTLSVGRVFIVNETALNKTGEVWVPNYNLFDWAGAATTAKSVAKLVADHLGNWAEVTYGQLDTPVYIHTSGLYSGTYWAFAVSSNGRVSAISQQSLQLEMCEVEVATLADLRSMSNVWRYKLTGEVVVTYEEEVAGGNVKFVQDATAGIMIQDQLGALPAVYGVGVGLTDLVGNLVYSTGGSPVLKFVPVGSYLPTESSEGNVVTPIELTYEEFKANCYLASGARAYESMLVKITTPMVVFDDYASHNLNWTFNNLDLATTNARGAYDYFIQSVFNSSLIGTPVPTVPAYYTGIRTNVNWGSVSSPAVYGLITPRSADDIAFVTEDVVSAKPNPVVIPGVLPGSCSKNYTVNIFNEGVSTITITALYLDDITASDEFNLVTPPVIPFTIEPWESVPVTIQFCPLNVGNETTNLIVEYGVGMVMIVPVNGETAIINAMPSCQTFDAPHPAASDFGAAYMGWMHPADNTTYLQNYVSNAWVSVDGSAPMNMRPRKAVGGVRQTTWMTSPGFAITGTDPVITWNETAATVVETGIPKNSPRNLYVSTNGSTWTLVDSYNSNTMPDAMYGEGWRTKIYSLADYIGQTIWWKWELKSVANEYTYWCLDNICVQERITAPIIVAAPASGDFGGVQLGSTGTLNFAVKNAGISVLNVTKVEIEGDGFTLTDANTYPFEVTSENWAYAIENSGAALNFSASFTPTEVGEKTGKITVTYGMYDESTIEIPLTGKGLSCETAAEAFIGENLAPTQGVWYKYTAEKFQITQITSCDPRNVTVPFEYSWDTFLEIYSDCNGTLIGSNDDMEAACPTNRANSTLTVVMNAGETVYIFWKLAFPGTSHVEDPFYFHIIPSYPIDGDVCETAIPLTLPVVNMFGTTVGFGDDYNSSPCSPFSNYMDGNDVVYTITLEAEGYLIGNLLGAYGSIHVLDVCPTVELEKFHCKAWTGGPNGGTGFRKKIAAGTYFVIISTWAPPQTVDFLLNMSWESGSAVENSDLMNNLSVYPNPTTGKFTVSISNTEATDLTIELVNISGQVVYRNEVKSAYSYNDDIDATSFAKGVYYLKVSDSKGVNVKKVVVQ